MSRFGLVGRVVKFSEANEDDFALNGDVVGAHYVAEADSSDPRWDLLIADGRGDLHVRSHVDVRLVTT